MKKNVNISVDVKTHEEFKRKVKNFSQWVEDKMKEELGKTEMKFLLSMQQFKLHQFWEEVLCHYTPAIINLPELKKQIGIYFGVDDRTYDKYFKLLLEFDYLRLHATNSWYIKRDYGTGWDAKEIAEEKTEEDEIDNIFGATVVKDD